MAEQQRLQALRDELAELLPKLNVWEARALGNEPGAAGVYANLLNEKTRLSGEIAREERQVAVAGANAGAAQAGAGSGAGSAMAAGAAQAGAGAGSDAGGAAAAGIIQRFTQLLQQTHISRPNARVLDLIQRRFSSRLITAATPEQAFSLYTDAQLLPGTSTSYILFEDYSLQLNGPFSEELPACILTATDMAGRPCIVKLLGRSESTSLPSTGRQTEADVCTQLQLAEANLAGIPVVHATLLEVALQGLEQHMQATKKHGPGVYRALLMPRYACVVSDQPQLTQQAILRGAERLVEAIKYIHGKDYVHMDVKASNVFVDADGRWFLGDFGATLPAGDLVFAYTEWFHRDRTLKGRPAQVAFDWYMLAVMLTAELHKKDWKEKLLAGDRVSDSKLRAAAAVATLEPLREILKLAMKDGQVSGVAPA